MPKRLEWAWFEPGSRSRRETGNRSISRSHGYATDCPASPLDRARHLPRLCLPGASEGTGKTGDDRRHAARLAPGFVPCLARSFGFGRAVSATPSSYFSGRKRSLIFDGSSLRRGATDANIPLVARTRPADAKGFAIGQRKEPHPHPGRRIGAALIAPSTRNLPVHPPRTRGSDAVRPEGFGHCRGPTRDRTRDLPPCSREGGLAAGRFHARGSR